MPRQRRQAFSRRHRATAKRRSRRTRGRAHRPAGTEGRSSPPREATGPGALRRSAAKPWRPSPATACSPPCMAADAGFATGRYDNLFFSHMICHPFEQMAATRHRGWRRARSGIPACASPSSIGPGWLECWPGWTVISTDAPSVPWLKRRPMTVPASSAHLDRWTRRITCRGSRDGPQKAACSGAPISPLRLHLSRAVKELEENLAPLPSHWPTACAGGQRRFRAD